MPTTRRDALNAGPPEILALRDADGRREQRILRIGFAFVDQIAAGLDLYVQPYPRQLVFARYGDQVAVALSKPVGAPHRANGDRGAVTALARMPKNTFASLIETMCLYPEGDAPRPTAYCRTLMEMGDTLRVNIDFQNCVPLLVTGGHFHYAEELFWEVHSIFYVIPRTPALEIRLRTENYGVLEVGPLGSSKQILLMRAGERLLINDELDRKPLRAELPPALSCDALCFPLRNDGLDVRIPSYGLFLFYFIEEDLLPAL